MQDTIRNRIKFELRVTMTLEHPKCSVNQDQSNENKAHDGGLSLFLNNVAEMIY